NPSTTRVCIAGDRTTASVWQPMSNAALRQASACRTQRSPRSDLDTRFMHPILRRPLADSTCQFHMACGSSNRSTNAKPPVAPSAIGHNRGKPVDGIPNVRVTRVERRETEAQNIGRAEVADHMTRDQRLNDLISVCMAKRHLAA